MPIEAYIMQKMDKKLITIGPEASFYEARAIIRDRGIRHLPVVDKENRLVGLITDRDIRKATPSDATTLSIHEIHYLMGKLKVSGFMTPREKLITITRDTMIERAVELMHDHKIGSLPVVEGDKLIGIITETDVLELFVDLFGLKRAGTRLTVALEDKPGQLHDILEVIKNLNVNIITVATPTFKVEGRRITTIRVEADDYERIVRELEKAGHEVLSIDNHKPGSSQGS